MREAKTRRAVWRSAGLEGLTVLLLVGIGCAVADPQAARAEDASRILTAGDATAAAEPDRVRVSLGIASTAPSAEAAVRANAEQVAAVREALRERLGDAAEISGAGYSLSPSYRYEKSGGRTLEHYAVESRLDVVLSDVGAAGRVVDVATRAGANSVSGVAFELADDAPLRARALAEATAAARAKADVVAGSVGLSVRRVVRISEAGVRAGPVERAGMRLAMAASEAPTRIETSAVEVHARVEMEVEAAP